MHYIAARHVANNNKMHSYPHNKKMQGVASCIRESSLLTLIQLGGEERVL